FKGGMMNADTREEVIEDLLRALWSFEQEYDANLILDRGQLYYILGFALLLIDQYSEEMDFLIENGSPSNLFLEPEDMQIINRRFPEWPEEGYVFDVVTDYRQMLEEEKEE
ncbi:MAG: hypothetical protein RI580_18460, partial [Halothece sp. Uz-M2-17]|nr:hypothetical protein [Halothece sp. Uz-M2-17]